MEYFDILDCTGEKTGGTIARDDAHRSGIWHGAFHCLITYQRNGLPYVLFQLRSGVKKIAPGKYDISVGGHYSAGEGPEQAGPREIAEELGLQVRYADLVPLGRRVFIYCFTPGAREYEFQDIFLLPVADRPRSLVLQREEVDAVLEVEVGMGIELFSEQQSRISCLQLNQKMEESLVTVSVDDFVPCVDKYYLKMLILAKRYAAGERKLLII